ncbi:MAG: MbtH family protein [Candidatus Binataceae bacterium]
MVDAQLEEVFHVVINEEEQYSIWAANRPLPNGWRIVAAKGSREKCLAYIEKVWTDMRPASLRHKMSRGAS